MAEEEKLSASTLRKALFDILRVTTTLPARFTFYASALGALFLMAGGLDPSTLPTQITALLSLVGVDAFAQILRQVAKGDTDVKIMAKSIQEAIEQSGIENALTNMEFQRELARLLREQHHLRYAIMSGQENVAKLLSEQYRQHIVLWEELRHDIVGQLEGIDSKTDTIIGMLQDIRQHLAAAEMAQPRAAFPLLDIHTPPTHNRDFVGRESIIENILSRATPVRFTVILGIPGSGKSELMRELASHYTDRGEQVFWYEFKAGLFSLDSILAQLAAFVDAITDSPADLSQKIRIEGLSYDDRIRLVIRSLNQAACFLFFDAYEESNPNTAIESFFSSLKQHLTNGSVFLASQIAPLFYTLLDERSGTVQTVTLEGFSQSETEAFFTKHRIALASQLAQAFGENVLPMSLVLALGLLDEGFQESDLLKVVEQAEDDSIETLFDKVYDRVPVQERELLTTACCFVFPFQEDRLLNAHRAISGAVENLQTVRKLKKRLLLQTVAPNYLSAHDIISQMMLKYAADSTDILKRLADHLSQPESSTSQDAMEAVVLYMRAKEQTRSADLFVELTGTLVTYYPDIAKAFLDGFSKIEVGTKQRMWLSHSQGSLHQHFRRFQDAEKAFSEMLRLAGELQDDQAAAVALLSLGTLYHNRDFQKAEKYYLQSLAILKSLNDIEGQSDIYNNLGSLYVIQGKLGDAELMLKNGLKLLEDGGFPDTDKLSIWGNLGHLYCERGQWGEADRYAVLVRDIATRESFPDKAATAEYDLGIHQYRQGNNEKALEHYRSALEIAERYHLWAMSEQVHRAMGMLYFTIGEYEKAIESFQALAVINEEIEDHGQLAAVNFDIGSFFVAQGETERATAYYETGLALFEHLDDEDDVDAFLDNTHNLAKSGESNARRIVASLKYLKNKLKERSPTYALAMVYGTLGHIYISILHKDRVGFSCLKQQVHLFGLLNRSRDMRGHQLNLASRYQDSERYAEAIRLTTEIIDDHNEEIDDVRAMSYYERATALVSLKQYDRAEADYQSALILAHDVENDGFVEDVRHNLAELYRRRNEPQKAIPLLQSTLQYTRRHQLTEGEIFTLHDLGLAYQDAEQLAEAEQCYEQSIQLARQHYMRRDEAKALISIGNLCADQSDFDKTQQNYEQALKVASEIEDLNLIEGSVISIAYTRWQNGTFEEFEPEFDRVAQQTADLNHYGNLFQFLKLSGQICISRGEFEPAAEMFADAMAVGFILAIQQFAQLAELETVNYKQSDLVDIFEVVWMICDWVDETLREYSVVEAREFYQHLVSQLNEELGGRVQWLLKLVTPLDEFLQRLPNQRAIVFVSARWDFGEDEEVGVQQ